MHEQRSAGLMDFLGYLDRPRKEAALPNEICYRAKKFLHQILGGQKSGIGRA